MKKILLIIFTFSLVFSQVEQPYPPLKLVSLPTGGTLPKGTYSIETLLMNNGGILPSFSLGITENLTFGVSFGLQEFIGIGNLKKINLIQKFSLNIEFMMNQKRCQLF